MITDEEIKELADSYVHKYYDCGENYAFISGFKAAQSKLYSEEEVKSLCRYAMEYAQDRREYAYQLIDDWFDNNKKK